MAKITIAVTSPIIFSASLPTAYPVHFLPPYRYLGKPGILLMLKDIVNGIAVQIVARRQLADTQPQFLANGKFNAFDFRFLFGVEVEHLVPGNDFIITVS